MLLGYIIRMEFLSLRHRDQQLVTGKLLRPLVTSLNSIRMMQYQTMIYICLITQKCLVVIMQ